MSHTPKTVRQKILRYPLKKWYSRTRDEYFKWVKETYGDVAEPTSYVEGYRAWMQVVWATEPIYRQPTQIITSQKIANEALAIMDNIFKEEYSKHEHGIL